MLIVACRNITKQSVLEALRRAERRLMFFAKVHDQVEVGADGFDHLLKAVPFDLKAATFKRAVFGKSREHEISAEL